MKRFLRENRTFFVVALTITALALWKVARVNGQTLLLGGL